MFPTLAFVSGLVAFTVPALCCREKEYSTRDGQCCSNCHEGTVVQRVCTQLSGTLCVPCVDGTFMTKPNGLTKCLPCATCDTGQGLFEKQTCTVTTDAVCDVVSGYFCRSLSDDGAGCSFAVRHKDCSPGQWIKAPGTSRSDTVCEDCPPRYFSEDGVNCTAWTVCSKTQKKVQEGSPSQDVVCAEASRGRHILVIPFCLLLLSTLGWLVAKVWISHTKKTLKKDEGQSRDSCQRKNLGNPHMVGVSKKLEIILTNHHRPVYFKPPPHTETTTHPP